MKTGLRQLLHRLGYSLHRASIVEGVAAQIASQAQLIAGLREQIDAQDHMVRSLDAANAAKDTQLQALAAQLEELRKRVADLDSLVSIELGRDARFRQIIGSVTARYFVQHERTPDISIPFDEVRRDSSPDWVQYLLDRPELSEPEFAVFQYFTDPDETVLDIGAHFGYSATSIWRAGCPAHILSIEPNPWHRPSLELLRELRPGRFDFIATGLSNHTGSLKFVVPVVEGLGIGGLCSAAIERELDSAIPENLVKYMRTYNAGIPTPRLQFAETDFAVAPLDDVLAAANVTVPLRRIAAIKIDVEGLEDEVTEGAVRTLQQHRPMLMVEGANRVPEVVARLSRLGYRYAEFDGGRIYLTEEPSVRVGGFFVHDSKLEHYRASGLLVAGPGEPAPLDIGAKSADLVS
ncbi:MAG: FkbM family methyltransferase [Acetobacteraceae bacterium]